MSSVQPPLEYVSRAARLDRILRELLQQTPGVEAAAVVSFDGLPMASALPVGMDEDRVAAMSAALLSLAERAAQGLGRGDLSQVYIEGENGTVFLVSAQDEAVLIAVTAAGTKVGMMLYEVKLAANRVGEVLRGPAPLPAPLPSHVTRSYLDEAATTEAAYGEPAYSDPADQLAYDEAPASYAAESTHAERDHDELDRAEWEGSESDGRDAAYVEPAYEVAVEAAASAPDDDAENESENEPESEPASEPTYASYSEAAPAEVAAEAGDTHDDHDAHDDNDAHDGSENGAYREVAYTGASALSDPYFAESAPAAQPVADPPGWSSYAPSGSVLPGGHGSWS
jgi:predicted regulator of Ras-like GTPase activity (Roadblock/LC7/MglB family)